jgi:hypothetical protein
MEFIVRPDGKSPIYALRLLAEGLSALSLPEGWSYAVSPMSIVLTAPDAEFAEGGIRLRHYERNKLANAELLVLAACNGRAELMPYYFQVDRPLPRAYASRHADGARR